MPNVLFLVLGAIYRGGFTLGNVLLLDSWDS